MGKRASISGRLKPLTVRVAVGEFVNGAASRGCFPIRRYSRIFFRQDKDERMMYMTIPAEMPLGTQKRGREIGLTRRGDLYVWVKCYSTESGRGCLERRWALKRGRYDDGQNRLCPVCVKKNFTPYRLVINSPEAFYRHIESTRGI